MTTAGDPAIETRPSRVRLHRAILVSNLVSGALWLSPLAFLGPPLVLIGAVYVVAGSVFLAAVYAHEVLSRRQEALAWIAPWLVAVALWAAIVVGISFENTVSNYLYGLAVGLTIGTLCLLAWQIVALAVRHFMAWRSGRSFLPS